MEDNFKEERKCYKSMKYRKDGQKVGVPLSLTLYNNTQKRSTTQKIKINK